MLPAVAAYGDWSVQTLRSSDPLPAVVDIVSGLLLLASAGRVAAITVGRVRALWSVRRACHRQGGRGGLIVVDSDRAEAFATPSAGGRIVVTTGLLRALKLWEHVDQIQLVRLHRGGEEAVGLGDIDGGGINPESLQVP